MNAKESKRRIEKLEREVKALRKLLIQCCIERDRMLGFVQTVSQDFRDSIWQPDWHAYRARAQGLMAWRLALKREFERDNPEVYRDC